MYTERTQTDAHTFLYSTCTNTDLFTQFNRQIIFTALLTEACLLSEGEKRRKKNSQVTNRAALQQLGDCLNPPHPSCPGGARESTDDITTKGPTKASIPLSAVTAVLIFSPASTRQNLSRSVSLTPSDSLPALLSPSRQPRLFLTLQKNKHRQSCKL